MDTMDKQDKLKSVLKEVASSAGKEQIESLCQDLIKTVIETALNSELDEHLGYEKHDSSGTNSGNSRNGYYPKMLTSPSGEIEINVPRDRTGEFEPKAVVKGQTRLESFDDKILSCYAKGMSTRDIAETFEEMFGARVSHSVISRVTESVWEKVLAWQNRPLDSCYPIVYLDCIHVKVRQEKRILTKAVYLALAVNKEGQKELLGMWISENEGAKFWLSVLTELKNRGVCDILIACVDGLTGFPDAIASAFPNTSVQLCIVHMVRNSLKYVSYKDRKSLASALKLIYASATLEEAEAELENFKELWGEKYPAIYKSWQQHWANLIAIFEYPPEIRKAIYTTNAIESLNSVIRKAVKNRRVFPYDKSALKCVFLSCDHASKKWTMPIRNWASAFQHFTLMYEGRLMI